MWYDAVDSLILFERGINASQISFQQKFNDLIRMENWVSYSKLGQARS